MKSKKILHDICREVVLLTLLAMLFHMIVVGHTFDCEEAKATIPPCIGFLIGHDDQPSAACCNGVKDLKSSIPTQNDRHKACECLKKASTHFPNIRDIFLDIYHQVIDKIFINSTKIVNRV